MQVMSPYLGNQLQKKHLLMSLHLLEAYYTAVVVDPLQT